jgi:Coenzyme PQQ synthesis protein D (PqqD)
MSQSSSRPVVSIRRRPDVVARRVGETAVLVHLGSNRIYELNDTGARIWALSADGATVEGLVDRLEREFEVDRGQLASEVALIVDDLVREGLFEGRPDA